MGYISWERRQSSDLIPKTVTPHSARQGGWERALRLLCLSQEVEVGAGIGRMAPPSQSQALGEHRVQSVQGVLPKQLPGRQGSRSNRAQLQAVLCCRKQLVQHAAW